MDKKEKKTGRTFVYTEAEHRKAKRNRQRLIEVKELGKRLSSITSQIK